jgi:hypothetical protein
VESKAKDEVFCFLSRSAAYFRLAKIVKKNECQAKDEKKRMLPFILIIPNYFLS